MGEARKSGMPRGFAASLRKTSILQNSAKRKEMNFSSVAQEAKAVILRTNHAETSEVQVKVGEKGASDFVEIVPDTMKEEESDDSEDEEDVEITAVKTRA